MAPELPLKVGGVAQARELQARGAWFVEGQRDLEIQDASRADFLDGDWRATAREIRAALDGYAGRLGIHAPYDGVNVAVPDRRIAQAIGDRFREALDFAGEIGATHCVVHSPYLFFGTAQAVHRAGEREEGIARAVENLAPVVAAAAERSCVIVFENICDLAPEPLNALVAALDSPWVRRSLDTGHANLMRPRGGPPADVWVAASAPWLTHVHLADNDGESDRHWACGEGSVNWRSCFAALAALPETPRLILEMSAAKQAAAFAWLSERGLAR